MNKEYPLVSVIMPSYNHEKYIEEAIRSVWDQTYSNVELIVLDDGSKDNSPKLIKELEKISPIPMKVVLKGNDGVCRTLNMGIELSKGEYIGVLASDDYYLSNKIEDQIEVFQRLDDNYAVVYSDGFFMKEDGLILKRKLSDEKKLHEGSQNEGDFSKIVKFEFIIAPQSALIRKQAILKVNGFDEKLSFEDLDLYLKLSKLYKFYFLGTDVVCYRLMDGGLRESLQKDEVIKIILKHIDFLDKKQKIDALGILYMKLAETSLYSECNIREGLNYYFEIYKLNTFRFFYYKNMFYFLSRCVILKVFGGNIVEFKRKIWK